MDIATRDFGVMTVEEKDIITFRQPIFGFESLTRFVMLMDDTLNGEFIWLQSVEDSGICFVLANPRSFLPSYAPQLPGEVRKALGDGMLELWLVMVVKQDFKASTVNLKSPIVLNLTENTGMQLILEDELPIRYPLFAEGEEVAAC